MELNSPNSEITESTSSSIQIKWANSIIAVDGIMLRYRPRGISEGSWKSENVPRNTNIYNITNLQPKTLYEIEVQIICNGEKCNSRNSKASSINQYTSAVMPIQVQILETYNKAVKVYWKYPSSDQDVSTRNENPFISTSKIVANEYVAISLHSDR